MNVDSIYIVKIICFSVSSFVEKIKLNSTLSMRIELPGNQEEKSQFNLLPCLIFHIFSAIIILKFYSIGLIACHGTKSSVRSKLKWPQSRACCSGYLYSFVELAMQILWVHGWRTLWVFFLLYVDVNKQEEQQGIIERKCLGASMADDRHLQTGSQ